jgi:hypothetical protein
MNPPHLICGLNGEDSCTFNGNLQRIPLASNYNIIHINLFQGSGIIVFVAHLMLLLDLRCN